MAWEGGVDGYGRHGPGAKQSSANLLILRPKYGPFLFSFLHCWTHILINLFK